MVFFFFWYITFYSKPTIFVRVAHLYMYKQIVKWRGRVHHGNIFTIIWNRIRIYRERGEAPQAFSLAFQHTLLYTFTYILLGQNSLASSQEKYLIMAKWERSCFNGPTERESEREEFRTAIHTKRKDKMENGQRF